MKLDERKNTFAEAQKLWANENAEEALELISKLESNKLLHPGILTLKYLCLATNKVTDLGLKELEDILVQALEIDSNYLPAILELAYFKLNVLDNPNEAIHLFEKATAIAQGNITEAVLGQAQCLSELKNSESAVSFIKEKQENLISPVKLKNFMSDIDVFATK